MSKRLAKFGLGFVFFLVVFFGSIALRDRSYEQFLQSNKGRVTVGMSEAEVIAILGRPTSKAMTDSPAIEWCYGSNTWELWDRPEVYCGSVGLSMSPNGHVVRAP